MTKKQSPNSDPCWKGYHQKGMKKKGTKLVPNCIPSCSSCHAKKKK